MNRRVRRISSLAVFSVAFLIVFAVAAAENRGNAAPRSLLPDDLRGVAIADSFLASEGKEAGVIQGVAGSVIVRRTGPNQAYYAAPGDTLYEKDTIYTVKDSRCKFKLLSGDQVTMGEKTKIAIRGFLLDRAKKTKSSAFQMLSGKAIFLAVRLAGFRQRSMTVETETAVSGVRGTRFGVEIRKSGGKAAAPVPVQVASLSDDAFLNLAQSTGGNGSVTVVHGIEGKVAVQSRQDGRSQTLGPGRSIESSLAGLGNVFQTPARVMRDWVNSIEKGAWKFSRVMDKTGKAVEEKMKKPASAIDRIGKTLEKKLKF